MLPRCLINISCRRSNIPRCLLSSQTILHHEDDHGSGVQKYRINNVQRFETDEIKRARLIYQSRKRGNLENGILLSTFADKYLDQLNSEQLSAYDQLINLPDNDWDIYYWVTEAKVAPDLFQTDVLRLLQEHSRNKAGEFRNQQPPLKPR